MSEELTSQISRIKDDAYQYMTLVGIPELTAAASSGLKFEMPATTSDLTPRELAYQLDLEREGSYAQDFQKRIDVQKTVAAAITDEAARLARLEEIRKAEDLLKKMSAAAWAYQFPEPLAAKMADLAKPLKVFEYDKLGAPKDIIDPGAIKTTIKEVVESKSARGLNDQGQLVKKQEESNADFAREIVNAVTAKPPKLKPPITLTGPFTKKEIEEIADVLLARGIPLTNPLGDPRRIVNQALDGLNADDRADPAKILKALEALPVGKGKGQFTEKQIQEAIAYYRKIAGAHLHKDSGDTRHVTPETRAGMEKAVADAKKAVDQAQVDYDKAVADLGRLDPASDPAMLANAKAERVKAHDALMKAKRAYNQIRSDHDGLVGGSIPSDKAADLVKRMEENVKVATEQGGAVHAYCDRMSKLLAGDALAALPPAPTGVPEPKSADLPEYVIDEQDQIRDNLDRANRAVDGAKGHLAAAEAALDALTYAPGVPDDKLQAAINAVEEATEAAKLAQAFAQQVQRQQDELRELISLQVSDALSPADQTRLEALTAESTAYRERAEAQAQRASEANEKAQNARSAAIPPVAPSAPPAAAMGAAAPGGAIGSPPEAPLAQSYAQQAHLARKQAHYHVEQLHAISEQLADQLEMAVRNENFTQAGKLLEQQQFVQAALKEATDAWDETDRLYFSTMRGHHNPEDNARQAQEAVAKASNAMNKVIMMVEREAQPANAAIGVQPVIPGNEMLIPGYPAAEAKLASAAISDQPVAAAPAEAKSGNLADQVEMPDVLAALSEDINLDAELEEGFFTAPEAVQEQVQEAAAVAAQAIAAAPPAAVPQPANPAIAQEMLAAAERINIAASRAQRAAELANKSYQDILAEQQAGSLDLSPTLLERVAEKNVLAAHYAQTVGELNNAVKTGRMSAITSTTAEDAERNAELAEQAQSFIMDAFDDELEEAQPPEQPDIITVEEPAAIAAAAVAVAGANAGKKPPPPQSPRNPSKEEPRPVPAAAAALPAEAELDLATQIAKAKASIEKNAERAQVADEKARADHAKLVFLAKSSPDNKDLQDKVTSSENLIDYVAQEVEFVGLARLEQGFSADPQKLEDIQELAQQIEVFADRADKHAKAIHEHLVDAHLKNIQQQKAASVIVPGPVAAAVAAEAVAAPPPASDSPRPELKPVGREDEKAQAGLVDQAQIIAQEIGQPAAQHVPQPRSPKPPPSQSPRDLSPGIELQELRDRREAPKPEPGQKAPPPADNEQPSFFVRLQEKFRNAILGQNKVREEQAHLPKLEDLPDDSTDESPHQPL